MKRINYLVSNKSSSVVTVTGRVPFTIPGNCEKMPLSLPDTDGTKATIQRFKREYPLISFVVVDSESVSVVESESPDASPDDNADGASSGEDNTKVSVEIFAASCEVKKGKGGEYVVTHEGTEYTVKANKPEDAIRIAFEQYFVAE